LLAIDLFSCERIELVSLMGIQDKLTHSTNYMAFLELNFSNAAILPTTSMQ